ncbi:hypothetical protein NM688_g8208 [Phlebia brevispora]|uniref:Uncharacterized protein n=1 Tax=Phlebia brevispora TaxID=194682 RepID=A0ACC1RW15_9APHY|nr:hypothetical protein NM688_g8208 [Phlebia brevispora]
MNFTLFSTLTAILFIVLALSSVSDAVPSSLGLSPSDSYLQRRTDPQFPAQPPSCPICAQNYSSISSCAQAAPVMANFSMIIFNPGAFIDVIKCACTDTFQSVYPQCVDCFEQTNQTAYLNTSQANLPSVLSGMQSICAIASTLLGGVATADGEVTPTSSLAVPSPTASTSAALRRHVDASFIMFTTFALEPRITPKPEPLGNFAWIVLFTTCTICALFLLWRRASAIKTVVAHQLQTWTGREGAIRLSVDDGPPARAFLDDDYDEDNEIVADNEPLSLRAERLKAERNSRSRSRSPSPSTPQSLQT